MLTRDYDIFQPQYSLTNSIIDLSHSITVINKVSALTLLC